MNVNSPTIAEMIEQIRDIPIYRSSVEKNFFPILEKPDIAKNFPENWMTPRLAEALKQGNAEFVLSTGTNHARMQIIRPPYFLLHSYYQLWSEHPDIAFSWLQNCQRVSIATVIATEHVVRTNARKYPRPPDAQPKLEDRRLDTRTIYVNQQLDPALWTRDDVERMLDEIKQAGQWHPRGWYHLDCSSYYLAHLTRKMSEWDLWNRFSPPVSIIHAYEYTPANVRQFLLQQFDCPIIDLFGSTELGYLYYSDRNGQYFPYLDGMQLELIPVMPGSATYSLIVSSVRNPFMPLMRYRSGDCVHTSDGSSDPDRIIRFCGREKELIHLASDVMSQADLDQCISSVSSAIFLYRLNLTGADRAQLDYTTFDRQPVAMSVASALQHKLFEMAALNCTIQHQSHIAIGKSGKYSWLARIDKAS